MASTHWARMPGAHEFIAKSTNFVVLHDYEKPSRAGLVLARRMREVIKGDWTTLFHLAQEAQSLPRREDKLHALSFYARVVQAWRPECPEGDAWMRAWVERGERSERSVALADWS